ncbi:MAG: hybrid sensor histidine kinase/response regulator, partial [Hyphomicrobiaceae bacterium]|nr:hybrid sensor histidine kinase/response regulator [Hyphomicrobiaceae bacterium]
IELNTLISDLVDFLQRSVAQQNVSIDVALSEDRLPVYVDVVLVEMALLNLVINARDAMPDGGTITISSGQAIIDETTEADWGTAAPGRYAFVQVADGGVGMAPEIKKKIFKAFFTTKEKGKGTGLGLSAVQDLARESDGFVQINSEPGKGTEVKVFLRSRRARRAT